MPLILARAALALIATFAPLAAAANPTGAISGRVAIAERPNATLAGFDVTVVSRGGDTYRTRTRKDGSFSFVGIEGDDVVVLIEHRDFTPLQCSYRLSPGGVLNATFSVHLFHRDYFAENGGCPAAPIGGGQTQDVYVIR